MSRNRKIALVFSALLALGIAVRVFGAWCYRFGFNLDHAVISLMARHMAEGRHLPAFFYGQSYMGTLEPMFSALCCRVFGTSGFNVCLGTAVVGMLLLPVVYLWARRAGGAVAGIVAMAFCIVGPKGYFHYTGSPRCYAILMLLTTLMLWWSAETVAHARRRGRVRGRDLFILGVLAGLGWWSSGLIMFGMVTVALVLLLFLHYRLLTWRLILGAAGFLAGSLPWWLWNLLNNFRSLRAANSFDATRFGAHLGAFWGDRMLRILQLAPLPPPARWLGAAIYVAAYLGLIALLVAAWRARRRAAGPDGPQDALRLPSLVALLCFFPVSSLLYSVTEFGRFDTARYHLPLIPAWAVVLGLGTAALGRGRAWRGILASIPVALLIGGHVYNLPQALELTRADAATHARGEALIDFCRGQAFDAVYADPSQGWLTFASREQPPFVPVRGLRYRPHGELAERADTVAVLDGHLFINDLLVAGGGEARLDHVGEMSLLHGFRPPPKRARPLPGSAPVTIRDDQGRDVSAALSDRVCASSWTPPGAAAFESLELTLSAPAPLRLVRVLFADEGHPSRWRISGRAAGQTNWVELVRENVVTPYFWSGPRPFAGGASYRLEGRLPGTELEALRIGFKHRRSRAAWAVAEVAVYGDGPPRPSEADALPALRQRLAERGIDRLYADRWVSTRLAADDGVWTQPQAFLWRKDRKDFDPAITWTPHTALLAGVEEAPVVARILAEQGLAMRSTPAGPWVLFDFEPGAWRDALTGVDSIGWYGWSCFRLPFVLE